MKTFKEKIFGIARFTLELRDVIVPAITAAGAMVFGRSLTAFAAIPSYPTISFTPDDIRSSMCNIVDWMFYFLIILAVIMVLVAGYLFVTAGDDTEKVSKARKTITYAAIAIVVAIIAKGFPALIASFLGASGSGNLSC
jgi:magnesium-transporting ATPase (P-type)